MASGLLLGTGAFPWRAFAHTDITRITILHTNDTHSRIEPFPMDGGPYQGLGGVAQRATVIEKIRNENEHVLLLDSGDIFQGTPYFNLYHGELEFKLMSELGYDAATIGNHDFDAGIDGLARQMKHLNFPLVSANYDFTGTVMEGLTRSYQIFQKGGITIGVFGLGVKLDGLVPDKLYGNTKYLEPVQTANRIANKLKKEYNCQLVICLSHLGYRYADNRVSDEVLARNSRDIDIILGGHTHTFFEQPVSYRNLDNRPVLVNQVGWAGIVLGRFDIEFDRVTGRKKIFASKQIIGRKKSV